MEYQFFRDESREVEMIVFEETHSWYCLTSNEIVHTNHIPIATTNRKHVHDVSAGLVPFYLICMLLACWHDHYTSCFGNNFFIVKTGDIITDVSINISNGTDASYAADHFTYNALVELGWNPCHK